MSGKGNTIKYFGVGDWEQDILRSLLQSGHLFVLKVEAEQFKLFS